MRYRILAILLLTSSPLSSSAKEPVIIDFEQVEISGRWIESWEEKGVIFSQAKSPTRSKAQARLMFFPHIANGRKGILSAMANDPIPVKVQFPKGATSVTAVLWGSTGCAARLEAYDFEGNLVDQVVLEVVPGRKTAGDPIPTFELTVTGKVIHHVQFSGPREGEYLVADAFRFTPMIPERSRADD